MVVNFCHFSVAGTQPVTYQIHFSVLMMMVRATYSFRKEMHNRLQMTLLSIYMFTQKLYTHLNVHGFFF